jgi:hypothetical protein
VPRPIRVVPEDLLLSEATVDAHADGMWLRHGVASGRIEAAQVGVPAGSAVALNAAVAKWHKDSTALFARMVEHAGALRAGAAAYEQTDEGSATELTAAGDQFTDVDLGL